MNGILKVPSVIISEQIKQTSNAPSPIRSLMLIGHRTPVGGSLPPLTPAAGFQSPSLYTPYQLDPTYLSDPNTAMTYMQKLGFTVNFGISGSLTLAAPNTVTVNVDTSVTLTWNTQPVGWSVLVGATSIQGAVVQGSASGTLFSVSTTGFSITVTSVTGTFATTGAVVINYINTGIGRPDPARTEEICMMVYYAVSQLVPSATLTLAGNAALQPPTISICLLSDKDTTFNPNPTPISLPAPSTVVSITGGVQLFWNTVPSNWAYVPTSALGASEISQATSLAQGTIVQQVSPGLSPGSAVGLQLSNVTGTFNTTNVLSMVLDGSFTIFENFNQYYNYVVSPYEIATSTQYNTNYIEFVNYINEVNAATATADQLFGTLGIYAVLSIPNSLYSTVYQPNTPFMSGKFYYYSPSLGDIPQTAAMVAADYGCQIAQGVAPFNPYNGLPSPAVAVSSNQNTYAQRQDQQNILSVGFTPTGVNNQGQAYTVRAVTTMLTLPGTPVPDVEFFPVTTWQIIFYYKYYLWNKLSGTQFQRQRMSGSVITAARGAVVASLDDFQSGGMFENVASYIPFVMVMQDETNPSQLDIQIPAQVIPELAIINAGVNIYSSLLNLSVVL